MPQTQAIDFQRLPQHHCLRASPGSAERPAGCTGMTFHLLLPAAPTSDTDSRSHCLQVGGFLGCVLCYFLTNCWFSYPPFSLYALPEPSFTSQCFLYLPNKLLVLKLPYVSRSASRRTSAIPWPSRDLLIFTPRALSCILTLMSLTLRPEDLPGGILILTRCDC